MSQPPRQLPSQLPTAPMSPPSETAQRIATEYPLSSADVDVYLRAADGCEPCTRAALTLVTMGAVGILSALLHRAIGSRCLHGVQHTADYGTVRGFHGR